MTTEFTRKDADEFMHAIGELKSLCADSKKETAEVKEMKENIISKLDKLEEKNQAASAKIAEQEKRELELKQQLTDLERAISRMTTGNAKANFKETSEFKAFDKLVREGKAAISYEEAKSYLRTNIDPDGGYLVPQDLSRELLKNVVEISPVRAYARVMTTSGRSLQVPLRTTIPTVYPSAQGGGPTGQTISAYDLFEIPCNKITCPTAASIEMLQDSAWNMEDQLRQDIELAIAQNEGAQFVNGTGSDSTATGFMYDSSVTAINSTAVIGAINFDDLFNLTNIKIGYKLQYAFNRSTRIYLQTLKDNIGDYLWQPAIAGQMQMTFNGLPYIIMQDMANIATGSYPVICGDFYQGYTIADKVGMIMIRDDVTQAQNGIVIFTFIRRTGGKVVKPEAFLKLLVQ